MFTQHPILTGRNRNVEFFAQKEKMKYHMTTEKKQMNWYFSFSFLQTFLHFCFFLSRWGAEWTWMRNKMNFFVFSKWLQWNKEWTFKGVSILSVPTVTASGEKSFLCLLFFGVSCSVAPTRGEELEQHGRSMFTNPTSANQFNLLSPTRKVAE